MLKFGASVLFSLVCLILMGKKLKIAVAVAITRMCSVENVFLKLLKIHRKAIVPEFLF